MAISSLIGLDLYCITCCFELVEGGGERGGRGRKLLWVLRVRHY